MINAIGSILLHNQLNTQLLVCADSFLSLVLEHPYSKSCLGAVQSYPRAVITYNTVLIMPLLFPNEQRSDALPKWQRWPDTAQTLPRCCPGGLAEKICLPAAYASLIFQMALKPRIRTKLDPLSLLPRNFYTYMIYVMIAAAGVTTVTIANYPVT